MKITKPGRALNYRGIIVVLVVLLATVACKAVTGAFVSPTLTTTPIASSTPAAATTPLPGESPTAIPQFNDAGVRYCYYVPGVSVPAQMPPEVLATPTPFVQPTVTPPPTPPSTPRRPRASSRFSSSSGRMLKIITSTRISMGTIGTRLAIGIRPWSSRA